HRVLTGNDPPHGQLRFLQLAHARALRAAPGRRRMAEAMASLGGATGASSRALAVVDGHARRGGSLRAELGSDAPRPGAADGVDGTGGARLRGGVAVPDGEPLRPL